MMSPACLHLVGFIQRGSMLICADCGAEFPLLTSGRAPKGPDEKSAIVSAGMVGGGLGTDMNNAIQETGLFNGKYRWSEEGDDKIFWIRTTEHLKGLGWSEERIAMACAYLRKHARDTARKELRQLAYYAWGLEF